ncbi:N-acetylneuraminate synthase family protein [Paenibacillus hodogayensis]|uniref:N-acetylneuraminate synthase family protein n=1 Tax=Paenibacillus hodogayensis TaxID=279208 RepID=A0ABV5VT53_9BACL
MTTISTMNSGAPSMTAGDRDGSAPAGNARPGEGYNGAGSRSRKPDNTVIRIRDTTIGGDALSVIGGPSEYKSREQLEEVARLLKASGAHILRGEFVLGVEEGMDIEGLQTLRDVAHRHGLLAMTPVPSSQHVQVCAEYADILAVGVRNMQNRDLLHHLGKTDKAVLLRRGLSATYRDLLRCADFILERGNPNVILLERGIRTFETYTSNTLDIAAIPALQTLSHLPVFADPTHAPGRREMVGPLSKAVVAAGASGIFIELDLDDDNQDGERDIALSAREWSRLAFDLESLAPIVGKTYGPVQPLA